MKIKTNRTLFIILNIFFILLVLGVGQCVSKKITYRMKVLTPPNQASIMSERIHFVVEVNGRGNMDMKLKVTHNYLFNKEVRLSTNHHYLDKVYFHFSVILDKGSNEIKLYLVDNKKGAILDEITMKLTQETDGIEATVIDIGTSPIIWHKAYQSTSLSEPYEPHTYKFHSSKQELTCIKCHDFNIQETDLKKFSCFKCHKDKSQDKNPYLSETQSINCMECHKLTQRGKYRFKQTTSEVCISCHKKWEKFYNRKYLHGPIEYGECWTCHDPHEGKEKNRLPKKVNKLCTSCHAGKHYGRLINNHPILSSVNNLLFGGREYKCTDCHVPHSSDANKFLLLCNTKGPNEPCKICHPEHFL